MPTSDDIAAEIAALATGPDLDITAISQRFASWIDARLRPDAVAVGYPLVDGMAAVGRCGPTTDASALGRIDEWFAESGLCRPDPPRVRWTVRSRGASGSRPALQMVPVGLDPTDVDGVLVLYADPSRLRGSERELAAAVDGFARLLAAEQGEIQAYRAVVRDPVTGLWSRRHAMGLLASEVARLRRYDGELSLVLVQIDGWAEMARQGPAYSQGIQRAVGSRIRESVRAADTAARLGEGRFIVLCPETAHDGGEVLAERIAEATGQPLDRADADSVTVRTAVVAWDEDTVATLLAKVDTILEYDAVAA